MYSVNCPIKYLSFLIYNLIFITLDPACNNRFHLFLFAIVYYKKQYLFFSGIICNDRHALRNIGSHLGNHNIIFGNTAYDLYLGIRRNSGYNIPSYDNSILYNIAEGALCVIINTGKRKNHGILYCFTLDLYLTFDPDVYLVIRIVNMYFYINGGCTFFIFTGDLADLCDTTVISIAIDRNLCFQACLYLSEIIFCHRHGHLQPVTALECKKLGSFEQALSLYDTDF